MKKIKIFLYKILKYIFSLPNKKKYFLFKKETDYLILENLYELEEIIKIGLNNFKQKEKEIYLYINKKKIDKKYAFDITHFIKDFDKNKIDELLSSPNILNKISDEFNLNISYDHFILRLNLFNSDSPEEFGPKMWHRDNDAVFGQLKFFFILNNLHPNDGGLFYFIPKKVIPDFYKLNSKYSDEEKSNPYNSTSRIKNYDVSKKYKLDDKIISFGNNNSMALVLDTNDTYHKGGYIKKKDSIRIMIQAIYKCNRLSLNIYDKRYRNSIFYNKTKIYLNGLKNRLRVNF